jgi:hypothetical protein
MSLSGHRDTCPSREDLVKTLDDAPPDQIATVDQRRKYAEAGRAEANKQ